MQTTILTTQQTVTYPNLPLAVYREIAAHLSQIEDVKVTILPQLDTVFDYYQSQVGGLLLEYPSDLNTTLLQQILTYYQEECLNPSGYTV